VTNPAIELDGIVKTYGRTTALDGLSLSVGRGELVGLLGPNGAGKTTTIKLLLGLARPTRGAGTVLGAPLGDLATRGRIGYLPELFRYQPWLRAREVMRLHAELAHLPAANRAAAVDEGLARVGLADRADDPVSGFSKGMQQRLGLGVALVGDPELILLDEPTSALDPIGRTDVRGIVRAARDRGATVILNSHLLSEVEQVCDRVVILHRGRTIASGPIEDVVASGGVRIRVTDLDETGRRALETFGPLVVDGPWLAIRPLDRSRIPEVVAAIVAAGGRVHAVEPGRGSLEARFLELVTDPPVEPLPPIEPPLTGDRP
jgi:ABC-2 type transport system ATP-binding protein